MPKYYARCTRDIVRTITMGAFVVKGASSNSELEIAPPTVRLMPLAAGTISVFPTKGRRDFYLESVNAEHPGAIETA